MRTLYGYTQDQKIGKRFVNIYFRIGMRMHLFEYSMRRLCVSIYENVQYIFLGRGYVSSLSQNWLEAISYAKRPMALGGITRTSCGVIPA